MTAQRTCKTCGLVKAAYMFKKRRSCATCVAAEVRRLQKGWYERNKERAREKSRLWQRKKRATDAAAYEREKERKRLRYRFDSEWRESELARFKAYKQAVKVRRAA